jgi:ribosomal protein S18 acetylase RimI-like enzyme
MHACLQSSAAHFRRPAADPPSSLISNPFSPPAALPCSELPYFTVLERESKVLGCAAMKPLGRNAEGDEVAELAAFCVHPSYRGGGKGDSLLEYLGG